MWTRIGVVKTKCKNKRVDALRGEWTLSGIAKRYKTKKVDALSGEWTLIGIAKKCNNKWVGTVRGRWRRLDCKTKRCKRNRVRVAALRGMWTLKIRGLMH